MYRQKLNQLKEVLREMESVIVAFSSGVDSTFLLKVAHDVLGEKVLAVTLKVNSLPEEEGVEAKKFCELEKIRHKIYEINELEIEGFSKNPKNRCYLCKKTLFSHLKDMAQKEQIKYVIEGSNKDDEGDYRPGMQAIAELGIKSPLREVGLTKEEIRILSRELNLSTWKKPSFACLSSRIPYGEEITKEKLTMIEESEKLLQNLGFSQVRVRVHGKVARIEVLPEQISCFMDVNLREMVVKKMMEYGFQYISLDLKGYRTGSLNEIL